MQRHSSNSATQGASKPAPFRGLRASGGVLIVLIILSALLIVQWRTPTPILDSSASSRSELSLGDLLSLAFNDPTDINNDSVELQQLTLNQDELNAALHAATLLAMPAQTGSKQSWSGASKLTDGAVELVFSFSPTPATNDQIAPRFNFYIILDDTKAGELPRPSHIRLGHLPLPASLVPWLSKRIVADLPPRRREALTDAIDEFQLAFKGLSFESNIATVKFSWQRAALDRLSQDLQRGFVSPQALAASEIYYSLLRDSLNTLPASVRAVALSDLLPPLAAEAASRSETRDPRVENAGLLYAVSTLLAEATGVIPSPSNEVYLQSSSPVITLQDQPEIRLQRRQDLAAHVINSAAIAATAGVEIASIISIGKEAFDAQYLSGFSFSDLAANRAGIKLAKLALQDEASAREFQQRLQLLNNDDDLIPNIGSNRDGLSRTEFESQYLDRASTEYKRRLQSIDQQLAQLPLFAGLEL